MLIVIRIVSPGACQYAPLKDTFVNWFCLTCKNYNNAFFDFFLWLAANVIVNIFFSCRTASVVNGFPSSLTTTHLLYSNNHLLHGNVTCDTHTHSHTHQSARVLLIFSKSHVFLWSSSSFLLSFSALLIKQTHRSNYLNHETHPESICFVPENPPHQRAETGLSGFYWWAVSRRISEALKSAQRFTECCWSHCYEEST